MAQAAADSISDTFQSVTDSFPDADLILPPTNTKSNLDAPNSWSPFLDKLATWLLTCNIIIFLLPPVISFTILKFYTVGPKHPAWDLKTNVMTNIMFVFVTILFMFKLPGVDAGEAKVGKMKRKGMSVQVVTIPACSSEYVAGWAKHDKVKQMNRPGFMIWPDKGSSGRRGSGVEKAKEGEKVILYFVGGGYVSGHPLRSHLAWTVSEMLDTRLFGANYRKSLSAESAFPGSLLDTLSAYLYLRDTLGFKPENIVLMGDSAGGGCSVGLARYLGDLEKQRQKEGKESLGQVGGMILFSPWVDMTAKDASSVQNRAYDYVWGMGARAIQSHIRHYPESVTSPYFSPGIATTDGSKRFGHLLPAWFDRKGGASAKQNGYAKAVANGNGNGNGNGNAETSNWSGTKVYIHCGTAELLYDQDKVLAKTMKNEGVDVRLREVEGDIHVGVLFKLEKPMTAIKKDLPEFWQAI